MSRTKGGGLDQEREAFHTGVCRISTHPACGQWRTPNLTQVSNACESASVGQGQRWSW